MVFTPPSLIDHCTAGHELAPKWSVELPEHLQRLLSGIYAAMNAGAGAVAAGAVRTVLDVFMTELVGDRANFGLKLQAMVEGGYLTAMDRDDLVHAVVEAGSAAMHRGYEPTPEHLKIMIQAMENILERHFVLRRDAARLRAATPARPPRK